jgi:hypothetical protein
MITTDKIENIYAKHGEFITSDEAEKLRNLFYQLAKIRTKKVNLTNQKSPKNEKSCN